MADFGDDFVAPSRPSHVQTFLYEKPTPPLIQEFVDAYSENHANSIAKRVAQLIEERLVPVDDEPTAEGVQGFVRYRAKTEKSLERKLKMWNDKKPYRQSTQIKDDVVDLAGVRVILFTPSQSQYDKVGEIVREIFGPNVKKHIPVKRTQDPTEHVPYQPIHLGYQAEHYWAYLNKSHSLYKQYSYKTDDRVEIQVMSALGHAWAEAEHDVLYKSYAYGPASMQEHRIFDAVNGLVLSADLLLQQLHELLMRRTFAKFDDLYEFESWLRTLDVLQGPNIPQLPELISRDCTEVLLNVLRKTGKNYPLAIRKAIRELGYPHNPQVDDILATFNPTFAPASGMGFVVCFTHQLLPLDVEELQSMGLIGNAKDLGSLRASEKCCLMISALALLQDVFGNERDRVRTFLIEKVKLSEEEKKSLDWIMDDPGRHPLLKNLANDKEQIHIAARISDAWSWFERQAHDSKSICGLAFRLAAVETTKPFRLDFLAKVKNIGTLSRSSTGEW
jgi:ppGpp synthetase/RelA/SpoT-type nucleotidyltranferase